MLFRAVPEPHHTSPVSWPGMACSAARVVPKSTVYVYLASTIAAQGGWCYEMSRTARSVSARKWRGL
jgi:hypothetical protein